MENFDKKLASLEALLFIHGEPMSRKKIEAVLELKENEYDDLIQEIKKRLEDSSRGLMIFSDGEKIQLATKPEFNTILEGFVKEELTEDLTPASSETLAIISYLGPISRAKIEYLRGVNSSLILRNLTMRGLIEKVSDDNRSSAFLYRITFDLMKHLGIEKKEDLPDYEKFSELSKVFDAENNASVI
jgi:segregation and condensation protein B